MRYRFTRDDICMRQNHDGTLILSVLLNGERIEHAYMGHSKGAAIRLFQQRFGSYPNDYTPVLVKNLNNHGGIAIMEYEYGINDYAIVCDNYGDGYKNITKNLIKYNAKGDMYIVRNRQRYYLNDFISPNIGKSILKATYYTDRIYGGHFTYEEMVEDARKNYDYGDPTNFLTYQSDWWKENYKVV